MTRAGDAQVQADEVAPEASVHASFHNHFSSERHLADRQTFKERRSAAIAEWRNLVA